MKLQLDIKFKEDCNQAAYEFIKEKLAEGKDDMAGPWLSKWTDQGGMSGTFERLVRQAEAAPEENEELNNIDKVIIYSVLLPVFTDWGEISIKLKRNGE
jgi:hypothetical protein